MKRAGTQSASIQTLWRHANEFYAHAQWGKCVTQLKILYEGRHARALFFVGIRQSSNVLDIGFYKVQKIFKFLALHTSVPQKILIVL